ncbi:MAG TPA: serine/threonine-protein kinase [Polyangiaceae bacterium]|nr:serine/threonine-protein kinase [Polyangiaceae bacterium]
MSSASVPPDEPDAIAEREAVAAAPPRAEKLGPYELLLELASGGMATVFLGRATDKRQGPPLVAIKRPHRHLSADKTFLTMLVDEARLASAIHHPNVVKVRELGFESGMPFIVMDYVEGSSLAELRRELGGMGRAIDVRIAVRIVLDALAGLQAAHELRDDAGKPLNIVHRDVSPHNILIACDGRSHITDFGIAKAEDRIQTTRTHEVKGKLAYLAPERIDKRRTCTVQSDVFSMAVVLWECFAGRRLFRGEEAVDVLQEVMSAPIPTLKQIGASVPAALDDVIAQALSRDLETRFSSASEFARALQRAASPGHIGHHADVARLMEAMFGSRMALRQEQVRAAVGTMHLADLLRESGLPARDRAPTADPPTGQMLADLAPPAPTGRYVVRADLRGRVALLRRRGVSWWSVAASAIGVAVGAGATLAIVARHPRTAPIMMRTAEPPSSAAGDAPSASSRRVVVPLPFLSTHVTFDEQVREPLPPTDVIAVDVPNESGTRHHVTAIALDGTRADGHTREEDGIARPDADGYAFTAPQSTVDDVRRVGTVRMPRPIGTVHNGFTKLR